MEKLKKTKSYAVTALFSLLSLIMMTYVLKIYPFGDKTFLWADADQYLSFEHYFGTLSGKNDVFYTWNNPLRRNAYLQLA